MAIRRGLKMAQETQIDLYRPSNGTEGCAFEATFCDCCVHQTETVTCDIWLRAHTFQIGDAEYPNEWRYEVGFVRDREPTCTAFKLDEVRERHNDLRRAEIRRQQQRLHRQLVRRWRQCWLYRNARALQLFLQIVWRPADAPPGEVYRLDIRTAAEVAWGVWR